MADVDISGYNLSGVDPDIIKKVIKQESGGNPKATSPVGAVGLMQLMPDTAADLGVTDRTDPKQSVEAGAKYLRQQLDKYNGDMSLALAAYNAGPEKVDMYGGIPPYPETQNYVASILGKGSTSTSQKPTTLEDVVPRLREQYSEQEIRDALGKKGYTADDLNKFFPHQAQSQEDLPWYGKLGQGALDTLRSAVTSNLRIPSEESFPGMQVRDPWHPSSPANVGQPPDPGYDIRGAIQQFRDDPWRAIGGLIPFGAAGAASNPAAATAENVAGATSRGVQAAGGYPATIGRMLFDRLNNPGTILKLPGLFQSVREGIAAPDAEIAAKVARGDEATLNWIRGNINTPQVQELFQRNPNIAKAMGTGPRGGAPTTRIRGTKTGKYVEGGSLTPEGQAEEARQAAAQQLQGAYQQPLNLQEIRQRLNLPPNQPAPANWSKPTPPTPGAPGTEGLRPENVELAQNTQAIREHWAHRVAGEMLKDGIKNLDELSPIRQREYAANAGYDRGVQRGLSKEMKPIIQDALDTFWRTRGRR